MEQGRCAGIDRACEEHESVGVDVGREAQDGMAVDARVLEVDPCGAI